MEGRTMDGIQTRVYCPACKKETVVLLERQDVPDGLTRLMRNIGIPVGNETVYKGETECSCGEIVKMTFLIEAHQKGEKQPDHQVVIRGGF